MPYFEACPIAQGLPPPQACPIVQARPAAQACPTTQALPTAQARPIAQACLAPQARPNSATDDLDDSWGKGPFDHDVVDNEKIYAPYNCNLGCPLRKWYAIGNDHCQGMFRTYAKALRLIQKTPLNTHELFISLEISHEWL